MLRYNDRTRHELAHCYEIHYSSTFKQIRLELYEKRTKIHLRVLRNLFAFLTF